MNREIVIVTLDDQFWTGSGFSSEYPEALILRSNKEASHELNVISIRESVRIVENYGKATEREL